MASRGKEIGVAAASVSAGAALGYGVIKLFGWLAKPKAVPAPLQPTHNDHDDDEQDDVDGQDDDDVDDQDNDDVDDQDDDDVDDEPEPTRAAPRQAKPEPTRAAPRQAKPEPTRASRFSKPQASRRGPVFIPRPVVEPEPVVEPWMKAWAKKIDAGIKAQERNGR